MVIPREPRKRRGLRRDYTPTPYLVTKSYLLGVLHDGTTRKTTYRIATKSHAYALLLQQGMQLLGMNAWIYQEGKSRSVWIVEFSQSSLGDAKITTRNDTIEYLRGYFDAEGGISKKSTVRYYIYFCQKDLLDLTQVRKYLIELGIQCGQLHNPSRRVDPDYWRFFIRAQSYELFSRLIGSNHPDKYSYLRMKR